MSDLWNGFRAFFVEALDLLHGVFDFVGDEPAWGFAIIALTLITRILMLPLAVKQTHSMRAMQQLQPKIKAIQKKYKTDRELMRKDPERYKAQKQKMNEEMTALYQEAGVNPAGGCLPLLLQAPIFLALYAVLRTPVENNANLVPGSALDQLLRSDFYFITPDATGLSTAASANVWGWALILLMAASMFWSQRQMMARTAATTDGAQQQQQKIMMYAMPVFLAAISFSFPVGVLLYWVTTNIWQIAQQAIILHEVEEPSSEGGGGKPAAGGGKPKASTSPSGKAGAGKAKAAPGDNGAPAGRTSKQGSRAAGKRSGNGKPTRKSQDHLPSRRARGGRG